MAVSVRSPKGRFGGSSGGGSSSPSGSSSGSSGYGSGSSGYGSGSSGYGSGSNQDSSSQRGGSGYPLPDPGAFGGSDEDDPGTSSHGSTSYTGGGSTSYTGGGSTSSTGGESSGSSASGGASKGKSTESSNGAGGMNISTGAIIGLVAGAVGFIFLMSCAHYWSREKRRSFEKDSRFRYEQVLWKSIQVITGIRLIKWFVDMCRDPPEEEKRDEAESEKPRDGHSNRPNPPYATFAFVNGGYQIIHSPGYGPPKKSEHGQVVYTPYAPVSPAPTLSPGRRSIHGGWPEAGWRRVSIGPGDVGPHLEEASARAPAGRGSGAAPGSL